MKHGSGNKTLLVGRLDTKQNRRGHMMFFWDCLFIIIFFFCKNVMENQYPGVKK